MDLGIGKLTSKTKALLLSGALFVMPMFASVAFAAPAKQESIESIKATADTAATDYTDSKRQLSALYQELAGEAKSNGITENAQIDKYVRTHSRFQAFEKAVADKNAESIRLLVELSNAKEQKQKAAIAKHMDGVVAHEKKLNENVIATIIETEKQIASKSITNDVIFLAREKVRSTLKSYLSSKKDLGMSFQRFAQGKLPSNYSDVYQRDSFKNFETVMRADEIRFRQDLIRATMLRDAAKPLPSVSSPMENKPPEKKIVNQELPKPSVTPAPVLEKNIPAKIEYQLAEPKNNKPAVPVTPTPVYDNPAMYQSLIIAEPTPAIIPVVLPKANLQTETVANAKNQDNRIMYAICPAILAATLLAAAMVARNARKPQPKKLPEPIIRPVITPPVAPSREYQWSDIESAIVACTERDSHKQLQLLKMADRAYSESYNNGRKGVLTERECVLLNDSFKRFYSLNLKRRLDIAAANR